MKKQNSGTINVPVKEFAFVVEQYKTIVSCFQSIKSWYIKTVAPDCTVRSIEDRYYFRAVCCLLAGIVFPPMILLSFHFLNKAKNASKQ